MSCFAPRCWLAAVIAPVVARAPRRSVRRRVPTISAARCMGAWDANAGRCKLSMTGSNGVHVDVTATYPIDLVDNPTAGPVLTPFVQKFFADYGETDANGTSDANLAYSVFTHTSAIKSVVFHADWYFNSMPHPSGADHHVHVRPRPTQAASTRRSALPGNRPAEGDPAHRAPLCAAGA